MPAIQSAAPRPLKLDLGDLRFDDDELLVVCSRNRELRIERTAEGALEIMTPVGGETAHRELEILVQLQLWSRTDGTGVAFGSTAGFLLPNGAMRAPDAAWVRRSRLEELSRRERRRFLPLAPDFVTELLSPSDRLADAQTKMTEYLAEGTRLGWILDPGPPINPTRLDS